MVLPEEIDALETVLSIERMPSVHGTDHGGAADIGGIW